MPRPKYDKSGRTLLVAVGDMHVGSTVALSPPVIRLENGGQYISTPLQNWIRDRWVDFWDCVAVYKRKGWHIVTVYSGEFVDGVHHDSTELASQAPEIMRDAALELLNRPLSLANDILVTRGTEAHSGKGGASDYGIAREMGARIDPETGTRAAYQWVVDIDGIKVDIAHHIGGGVNPAKLELGRVIMDYDRARQSPPDIVIRGHIHRAEEIWLNRRYAIVTPAWQAKSAFAHRVTRNLYGEVGGLLCEIYQGQFSPKLVTYPYEVRPLTKIR